MNTHLLSILICGLEERKDKLDKLIETLRQMIGNLPVEVLSLVDNRQMPTGEKRNKLIEMASGEYITFVDDDDNVSPDYVSLICAALSNKPDCVGIRGILYFNPPTVDQLGRELKENQFVHSIDCPGWYTGLDGVYYRSPNHLNPVKRSIALETKFNPFLYIGEDIDYSNRISPLLKTEERIDEPIYFYQYSWQENKKHYV